jgi:aminoglycoside phosphotransferase (APT) family kinase protein
MSADPATGALDDFDGLVDWPRFEAWLATQDAPGSGPVTGASKLAGGISNAVILIERGAARFVLRRPGKHLRPKSNETIQREVRVLRALAGTDVPHPRPYAACDDASVIGASFYLMEALEGFAPNGPLLGRYGEDPAWRYAMGQGLVRAAAALAAADVGAVGLSDLGKPDQWHERQVDRWRSQLESYAATPGYDPKALPNVDVVGRWLSDNLPADRRIGLIHGDLQFPNLMFSLREPQVSGIIDWELATLGDPLLDLAWILTSWREAGDPEGNPPMVTPWDSFPPRAELVSQYGQLTGRDTSAMPWFFALACYKLACLLEGTYAASKAGKAPAQIGETVHAYATWLMAKAMQIIAG